MIIKKNNQKSREEKNIKPSNNDGDISAVDVSEENSQTIPQEPLQQPEVSEPEIDLFDIENIDP